MKANRMLWARYGFCAAVLAVTGYLVFSATATQRANATARVAVGDTIMRVAGPYAHDNLAVYLVLSGAQDPRTFITLDEGLKTGVVKVTEKTNATVNELLIENTSDFNLFLQEGDTLKGGQQDRTIYAGHIVPPHSPAQPLPAFCVEPSRWVAGAAGAKFDLPANAALAPKEVRQAAKYENSQDKVWAQVAAQREVISRSYNLEAAKTSSLNEVTEKPQVRNAVHEFIDKLAYALDLHPDAVGVAIVINGQVEEVNVYPNNDLLRKQFNRLVGSYAPRAVVLQKEGKDAPTLTACDVACWMYDEGNRRAAAETQVAAGHAPGMAGQAEGIELRFGGVAQEQERAIQALEDAQALIRDQRIVRQRTGEGVNVYGQPPRNPARGVRMTAEAQPAPSVNVINAANSFEVQPLSGKDKSVIYYEKKAVHVQFMGKPAAPAQPQARQPALVQPPSPRGPTGNEPLPQPQAPNPPPRN
jgi:hypothetical protein